MNSPPFEGRFERIELPGQVHLHLAPTRKFKTLTLKIFARCDLEAGVASEVAALPFILRRGTAKIPSQRALSQALENLYGASLEPNLDKVGEEQVLSFTMRLLGDRFLPEPVLERGVNLLHDLLWDPVLDEAGHMRAEEVSQELEKIRRRIEALIDDKGAYASERCVWHMCQDEPYSVFEFGSLEDLPGLNGERLEARRRALVERAPLDIYAIGAFDPDHLERLVREAFSGPRLALTELRGTMPNPAPRAAKEITEQVGALKQSKLCIGLRAPDVGPNFWDLLLMVGVLGGFPHSKLFRNVREAEGLAYNASASLEQFKGLVFLYAGIEPENAQRAKDACLEQLEAIRRGEITVEELESTQAAYRQAYRGLLDLPGGLINFDYLSRRRGQELLAPEAIAAVDAVTADGVQAAAESLWLDTVFLLEPKPESESPATEEAASA
ncbi:MAG: insulinase family protein [Planctomycetes bacterium]|nr:insulinase family protein [Planctomycetota bacterium]